MNAIRQKISQDYFSLIGTPYEEMNCWEAARSFYLLCLGVELKHYCDYLPENRNEIKNLIYSNAGDFEEIKSKNGIRVFEFGDVILFKIKGIESHLGVFVGKGQFFHSTKGVGACVERLDRWKAVISGVYRLKMETSK